jgi:hypothetical protein
MKEGLKMDFLFNNNGIKNRIVSVGLVIAFLILTTFLVNALAILLPIAAMSWLLYKAYSIVKAYFNQRKRKNSSLVFEADIVNINTDFDESLASKQVIDVEYTEV